MIKAAHDIGGHEFIFRLPPTAADVLDWRLWTFSLARTSDEKDAESFVLAACTWAAQWLEPAGEWDVETLSAKLAEVSEKPFDALVELCNAIADASELPPQVAQDIRLMLDRKNEVPEDWKPAASCRCRQCTGKSKGLKFENPPGEVCVFDGIDARAELALALVPFGVDTSERPYIAQVRTAVAMAESRRLQHEEDRRKAEADSKKMRDDVRQRMGVT